MRVTVSNYLQYYRSRGSLQILTWVSLLACVIAVVVVVEGLFETQAFALSQAHDLSMGSAIIDRTLAFDRLATHSALERILIYLDGVKFQVWIAIALLTRLFGLLMKTKLGMLLSGLGLLFSAYQLFKYFRWSWNLLYCESCLQKRFLIAVPQTLSYLYLLSVVVMALVEIALLVRYFVILQREPNGA